MIDFSTYKFHPSSLGLVMTEARNKSDVYGETCKAHLLECWIEERYKRERELENKYVKKGLMVEEDSVTLYSRVRKRFFTKNEEQITNDFLIGTPDLFIGDSINAASEIIDLKSSWDIYTFFQPLTKAINPHYFWQLQGYMDLTGAQVARLVYCLIDTPEVIINDEKRKLLWRMGVTTELNPDYVAACEKMDRAMRFDDIPIQERFIEFEIRRDQEAIDRMHEKVELCRKWLYTFELAQYSPVAA